MNDKDKLLNDVFQYRRAVVLLSAANAGLFDLFLNKIDLNIQEVITTLNWSGRAAEITLNALCAMGYLRKAQENYSIAPKFQPMFTEENYPLVKEWLNHEWRLLNRWIHFNEVLVTGKPYRETEKTTVHRNHQNFILSMAHREKENLFSMINAISLEGYQHLLDLGGGPGFFAIAFAEKYPALKATVFDTPETQPIANKFINASSASSKINFIGGDFLKDDFGNNYDVILLSSVLHIYGPDENENLLKRVYQSLKRGGRVIIRDFFLNRKKTSPLIGALFAVNMLINTDNGNAYSYGEMINWLKNAGFTGMKKRSLEGRMALLEGYK